MNPVVNELAKSVVDKNSLGECSVAELQQMVSRFPYFGPAQFLLARKLKQENSPAFEQQSQKAILYFRDHLWFDYLSGDDNTGTVSVVKKEELIFTPGKEPVASEKTAEPIRPEIQPFIPSAINTGYEPRPKPVEEPEPPAVEEPLQAPAPVNEPPAEPVTTPIDEPDQEESGEESGDESGEESDNSAADAKLTPLPGFKIEHANAAAQPLIFEPYHTVDYFASQGIKFKEEEKPKDKFGQQLKSFTEWLKAMKKLPETAVQTPQTVVADDQKVVQLADRSITDRQVVTEAMAEVWEKQGNPEKAAEIYRKLSLLNPAKSSYFAAKIEHLKNL